jgi:hypothetical protein
MNWIRNDIYKALISWLFMLVSGLMLIFSFGENGRATPFTFLYLVVMLFIGLFMLITVIRRHERIMDIYQIPDDSPEVEEAYEAAILGNIEEGYVNPEIEAEEFLEKVLPFDKKSETPEKYSERVLRALAGKIDAVQALMFLRENGTDIFHQVADFALYTDKPPATFKVGETLPGQVAKNKKPLNITNVPEGYMTVLSGLGSSSPGYLYILPFLYKDETVAVAELASFTPFSHNDEVLFGKTSVKLGNELGKSLFKQQRYHEKI